MEEGGGRQPGADDHRARRGDRRLGAAGAAFLVSNGIAYYGDHGDEIVTEESPSLGNAFLTGVTQAWQEATTPAVDAGSRVCVLRTSPVATKDNPLFKLQMPLFKLGLGARMGSGRQYAPLISLRDWVGAVAYLAEPPDRVRPVQPVLPGDTHQRGVHRRAGVGAATARRSLPRRHRSCASPQGRWRRRC